MNFGKLLLVLICAAFLTIQGAPVPRVFAAAQEVDSVDIPVQALHDNEPITLTGLHSSQTVRIPIPKSWLLTGEAWINISIKASDLLDFQRSTVVIELNGQYVKTLPVSSKDGSMQKVLIPITMLTQGNNDLVFTGTLFLPTDQATNCKNWADPSRRVTIDAASNIHLSLEKRVLPVNLSSFPDPFIEPLEKYLPEANRSRTVFVLPDQTTQDDLTSLSTVAYVLGSKSAELERWNPEIITESQFRPENAAYRNFIFINNIPAQFQGKVPASGSFIAMAASTWTPGNVILFIGDSQREDGFSPAIVLADPSKSQLLHGSLVKVDPYQPSTPVNFAGAVSFSSLGYLDRTVRGSGKQEITYRLYIPSTIQPEAAEINLQISHAPGLNPQTSSMNVYFNGSRVAKIMPTAQTAAPTPIDLQISSRRFHPGVNYLRIAFDLQPAAGSCDTDPQTLWGMVGNISTVRYTYQNQQPMASLRDFPLPYADHPGTTLVIPDQVNLRDSSHLAQFAFLLGKSAFSGDRPPTVRAAAQFDPNQTGGQNIILVGLPKQNRFIHSLRDLLPQPFTVKGDTLAEGFGVSLPGSQATGAQENASLGVLQTLASPWAKGRSVLVLSANNEQGLDWVWEKVDNPDAWSKFTGNLMLVHSGASAQAAAGTNAASESHDLLTVFQQTADVSQIPWIGSFLQKNGKFSLILSIVAEGFAILLIGILFYILNKIDQGRAANMNSETSEQEKE